jgi:hypothetical protein
LDKVFVIDIYLRVSLVGIELLTVDARIVIASVDAYLRFVEAVNRLDIAGADQKPAVTDLAGEVARQVARGGKTEGVLEGSEQRGLSPAAAMLSSSRLSMSVAVVMGWPAPAARPHDMADLVGTSRRGLCLPDRGARSQGRTVVIIAGEQLREPDEPLASP